MPRILNDVQMNLYELPMKLGLTAAILPSIPIMPDYTLAPWAPDNAHFGEKFDQTKADCDNTTANISCLALGGQNDALFNERLKEVNVNIERIDEGLVAVDDVSARDYEVSAQTVKRVEEAISATFAETLEESLADDIAYIISDHNPTVEDLSIPQLHAPLILDGPRSTKCAEIYSSGNIRARQLMSQTDRKLELRRLSALLVAAQRSILALEAEETKFQEEIAQLQEANEYLSEA